ncbi:NosD domain-containing protein [Galbitalea soli]|uniref:Fructotransferase n=1 Tax=Galbitalea soli TaxID=1268042 RepID=A0A7C9PMU2_9MICO|nr:NosD domain-containing protein [Galbitalea soli]NEM91125.1 fructotransferase [Galbitalea soli]NYJ29814.1 inulin fructotransferase (DFA-I-forming) [Galbitalea soli]
MSTVYDVTAWTIPGSSVTCYDDIGAVINSMIADVKAHQTSQSAKPGAVIYIPPGDYPLKTRVTVDISYLTIRGSGHGFTSLSIRYNTSNTSAWYEINPGSSHVTVQNTDGNSEAFIVTRGGDPRLSSVTFENFCLDGMAFTPNENSYTNGKIGIRFDSANDSAHIQNMGFVYLEHALIVKNADALRVTDNFIAECGNCIKLTGSGQASTISNNSIGAGYVGYSIYAESFFGLLVTGNNVFPRGKSSVTLVNCTLSSITSNRFHAFYPGVVNLSGVCTENLISGNHFYRQPETYGPFVGNNNGLDDLFGLVQLNGSNNALIANHFSFNVPSGSITPSGATPTLVLVKSGDGNYLASNHFVANVAVHTVVLDASTTNTHVMDSGTSAQFQAYSTSYGFRATP